jgi:SAM-dependent methyltransferase
MPLIPIGYWLQGVEKIITLDLHPYMKAELTEESLRTIVQNRAETRELFGSNLVDERMEDLVRFSRRNSFSINAFLDLCGITYIAPGDAANTGLPAGSIDYHTSYTVFEHIPADTLRKILQEGLRIIKHDGLFVHLIDYSDHFAHSDRGITAVNFLRYSDQDWERIAGSRYNYMNRLRHDDYISLFEAAGYEMLEMEVKHDPGALEALRKDPARIDARFRSKPLETLAISSAWMVTRKKQALGHT